LEASYVGSGDEGWSCYTHFSIPNSCDTIYQDTVTAVSNLFNLQYNLTIQYNSLQSDHDNLQSDHDALESDKATLEAEKSDLQS
jgi:uncharacterized protein (DUF3084 family)